MKKSVIVGLCAIVLIALAFEFRSDMGKVVQGEDLKKAISDLQRGGYSDVKVLDTHYVTAIPPGFEPNGAGSVVVGSLDSFTAIAHKAGKTVKLMVRNVGLSTKVVEEI